MVERRTLAIVTHRALDSDASGSFTYLRALMKDAREIGFDIELYCASRHVFSNWPFRRVHAKVRPDGDIVWPAAFRVGDVFVSTSARVWLRFVRRLAQEALRVAGVGPEAWRRVPSNLGEIPSDADLRPLAAELEKRRPDAILVEYSSLAPLFDRLERFAGARACLMHDSFAARAANFRASGDAPDHVEVSLDEEVERLKSTDLILYAASTDIPVFEAAAPRASHIWFRPTVRRFDIDDAPRAPCLFFLGTDHAGNRDAIRHFINDVWPDVLSARPEATLKIGGDVGKTLADAAQAPGVEILGRIPDLAAFASPDVIGLAPTRLASGVSIKIAEYLGMGMPCVSYPMGLDGFGDALDIAVRRADTPEAYGQACIDLLADRDLRLKRSAAGRQLALDLLSDSGVKPGLDALAPSGDVQKH